MYSFIPLACKLGTKCNSDGGKAIKLSQCYTGHWKFDLVYLNLSECHALLLSFLRPRSEC